LICSFVLAALLGGIRVGHCQEPTAATTVEGFAARLEFWGSEYDPETGAHGATTSKSRNEVDLRLGEARWIYVASGMYEKNGSTVEGVYTTSATESALEGGPDSREVTDELNRYPLVWEVRVVPRGVSDDRVVLGVDWRRLESRNGAFEVAAEGKRKVALAEGDTHVLDFVEVAHGADPDRPYGGAVQLSVVPRQWSAAPSPQSLRYDFWYTFRSSGLGKQTRKLRLVGRNDEELSFRFLPVRFSFTGEPVGPGNFTDVVIDVSGTIRGVRQPGGRIRLELYTMRSIDMNRQGAASSGARNYGGATTIDLTSGESVRIELPPPQAMTGSSGAAFGAATDVFLGADEAIVITVTDDTEHGE
jgi:hypothetical protein